METATPVKTVIRCFLSETEGNIAGLWEKPLLAEGFGRTSVWGKEVSRSVVDELDDLLHYRKLMCFFNSTEADMKDRERFIIDYAAPFYTLESLQTVIVDRQSFVKRVVKAGAMLYKDAATRRVYKGEEIDEKADAIYQEQIKGAAINVKAKQWHRIYTLCDIVAIKPVVKTKRKKETLQYDVIPPDSFRLLRDAEGNVVKFLYSTDLYNETDDIMETVIAVWTDTEHYYRNAKGEQGYFSVQPEGKNPYGTIPVVIACRDDNEMFTGGLSSLVEANLKVCALKMLESEDSAFAAISLPFGLNLVGAKEKSPKFSPRSPIFVTADTRDVATPDLKFVSGEPHSAMLRELQQSEEKTASMREGIAPYMLSDNPQEMSGKAMKIALTEIREQRQDDAGIFEAVENELFEVQQIVVSKSKLSAKLGTGLTLQVDFAEQQYDDDPKAEYELDRMKMQDNVISAVDMFRKWNTDMDNEQEVVKAMTDNKRINSSIKIPTRAPATEVGKDAPDMPDNRGDTDGQDGQ